jgi:hypothetical protein
MPMRVVSNTTLLLEGAADGTLQVLVGKLLPAVLAVRQQSSGQCMLPATSARGLLHR